MHTIGVLAPKGGVGKTSTCIHLAVLAEMAGLKVALLDTDHPQGSLSKFINQREGENLLLLERKPSDIKAAFEEAKAANADLVIIDGTPNTTHNFQNYAPYCDLILSPMKTSFMDREAVDDTLKVLPYDSHDKLHFMLSMTRSKRKGVENYKTQQVREYLANHDQKVCPIALTYLTDYEDSLEFHQTVVEYNPEGTAAKEVIALWDWICEELNNG